MNNGDTMGIVGKIISVILVIGAFIGPPIFLLTSHIHLSETGFIAFFIAWCIIAISTISSIMYLSVENSGSGCETIYGPGELL